VGATSLALDRRPQYYGTKLSENIIETPDGFLICKNAVIGRSGFQTYRISEITDPDGLLADRSPDDEIELWRDPTEVFSKPTLASFEGMAVTLTHPDELLNPENVSEHHIGHVQNVRKGEQDDSSNFEMLGDLHIKSAEGIDAVKSGERQLSCGYTYKLARENYRYEQRNITGNHVAIVPKGRAGTARINDAAPEEKVPISKEKPKVTTIADRFKHILGLGMKEFAKDAAPEDVAAMAEELGKNGTPNGHKVVAADSAHQGKKLIIPSESGEGKEVYVGRLEDGTRIFKQVALDEGEEEEKEEKSEDEKEGEEKSDDAKDAKDGSEEKAKGGLTVTPPKSAFDRKKLHDAVDRMVDEAEKEEEETKDTADAADADLEELKRLMNGFLGEEEKEGIHKDSDEAPCKVCGKTGEDCTCGDSEEEEEKQEDAVEHNSEAESEKEAEKEEKGGEDSKGEAEDAEVVQSEIVRSEPMMKKEDLPKSAFDATKGLATLNALKPFVARANDQSLTNAFDTIFRSVRKIAKAEKGGNGSYGKFRAAASKVKDSPALDEELTPEEKAAKAYEVAAKKVFDESKKRSLASTVRH
jgi:hypothetical protein